MASKIAPPRPNRESISKSDPAFDVRNYEYDIGLQGFDNNWSPFKNAVWPGMGGIPITKEEVKQAVEEKRCRSEPMPADGAFKPVPRKEHIERVAFLATKESWDGEVVIDLSAAFRGSWAILDGNHRVAAALYRSDKTIKCRVHGYLDHAELLFGITPKKGPSWVE